MESPYYFAADSNDLNEEAKDRSLDFHLGYYAHPIFHANGNYPQVMIDRIGKRSDAEGFRRSRLPTFTSEDVNMIRGTADYLGLNHYSSSVAYYMEEPAVDEPSYAKDLGTFSLPRPNVSVHTYTYVNNFCNLKFLRRWKRTVCDCC